MKRIINNFSLKSIVPYFFNPVSSRNCRQKKILNHKILITIIILLIFFSCKPKKPLTPQHAFKSLKIAVISSDIDRIKDLLSQESIKKIEYSISIFSNMSEEQIKSLSDNFDVPEQIMKNMSVKDYIQIYLSLNNNDNLLYRALSHEQIGISSHEDSAIIRMENGMELKFVKEGPYWKFDMSEL